ncbi:MAG: hypothetical protein IBJ09_03935 [Bacteroidia bacterium]|nr:hypothetical protein [Bacteroidia bacterium]
MPTFAPAYLKINKRKKKMKGLTKLFAGVFAASILASCGGGNTPDKAATEFLNAVKAGDKAKYEAVSTEATKSMMTNSGLKIADVKDVKCTNTSDTTATCTYCCEEGKTESSNLNLVKRSDKWLVDMKKEAGLNDAMNSMTEGLEAAGDSAAGAVEAAGDAATAPAETK